MPDGGTQSIFSVALLEGLRGAATNTSSLVTGNSLVSYLTRRMAELARSTSPTVPIGEQLPPGNYKVEWHAVSEDTHREKGTYAFSVGR